MNIGVGSSFERRRKLEASSSSSKVYSGSLYGWLVGWLARYEFN